MKSMKASILSPFKCILSTVLLVGSLSCNQNNKAKIDDQVIDIQHISRELTSIPLNYAENFSLKKGEGFYLLTISNPWFDADQKFQYVLKEATANIPSALEKVPQISIPVNKIVCTSTTHIPLLDALESSESLIGFPNTDLISSTQMRQLIDQGKVQEIGKGEALDVEKIIALNPDLVMAFSMSSDLSRLELLKRAGIPYLLNADFLEKTALGRAEWIKFAGVLLGKEQSADSIFQQIESNYLQTKSKVASVVDKPSVISGVMYKDIWYAPAGENWSAQLFADAGADYLWKDKQGSGSLQMSIEQILTQADEVDKWVSVASFRSLEEMENANARYIHLKPFKEGEVYNYTKKIGAKGGFEYLELGYMRPDIVLADLAKIFHPEQMTDHKFYFYEKLPR